MGSGLEGKVRIEGEVRIQHEVRIGDKVRIQVLGQDTGVRSV